MAKGKKSKSSGKVSAGIHSTVSARIVNSIRRDYVETGARIMNQLIAFNEGKRVMVTIENPNKNETNKRFIRVPASTVWKSNKPL